MSDKIEKTGKGIFFGIGVGPGGAENMTLKAVDRIKKADVIILPASSKDKCRSYATAREAVKEIEDKLIICQKFPMSYDKEEVLRAHEEIIEKIVNHLESGKNTAFLTIGDPCIYSTYGYIRKIIEQKGFETQTVNGIASFCLAASSLGIALGEDNEQIHIIPGQTDVKDTSNLRGTRIFMKSGRRLAELKEYLAKESEYRDTEIYTVTNCGLEDEKKGVGISSIKEEYGYLTLVIVKDAKGE